MIYFALGFLTCAWVATMLGVAYVLWRFAYVPFGVVRRDVGALAAKLEEHKKWSYEAFESTRKRMSVMSEAELASIERRLRRESTMRAANMEREG